MLRVRIHVPRNTVPETKKTMIMRFGQYEGKSVNWVHKHHPRYLRWLVEQSIPFPGLKSAILTCLADDLLEQATGPTVGFKSWKR